MNIVDIARTYIGTPWQHQGRLPGAALDCAGVVICAARQAGIKPMDWDVNGYPRTPDGTMMPLLRQHLTEIAEPEIGCVICVRTSIAPQHVGIVAGYRHGGLSIIHAHFFAGKTVETRLMWARNFSLVGSFRL